MANLAANIMQQTSHMPKVNYELTMEILEKSMKISELIESIEPEFHPANTDRTNGCPNIPSDRKINRYLEALKAANDPSSFMANSIYNEIMRNAAEFLTESELSVLVTQLTVYKNSLPRHSKKVVKVCNRCHKRNCSC